MVEEKTALDQVDFPLPPHTLFLHTYEVERELPNGGMGNVYLARHVALNTKHAIKIIKPELSANPQIHELLQREAENLRRIRHDAIVGYEGFLLDEKKNGYLVMEYVDGPSLKQVLTDHPLSIAEIYLLRDRLASGLSVVHDKGTFHRDISPDNIILPGGHVENAKLIDFGIAKRSDPTVRTIIGDLFAGKRGYAAPEQLGLYGGKIGSYSDIYSLGLVLAAAVTGRSLDMGSSNETAIQARQRAPDLSQMPSELQPQLTAMLQPNPADRPQSIAELIQRWPRPLTQLEELKNWLKKKYMATLIVISIVVIGVMGSIFIFSIISDENLCIINSKQPVKILNSSTPMQREQLIVRITRCSPEQLVKKVISLPKEWSELVMAKLAELPPEQIASYAQKFYNNDSLDHAFVLWKWAAEKGHGPSALMLGELYDPVLWNRIPSPFDQPNPKQAEKWYKQASEHGIENAATRLRDLAIWKREHPTDEAQ